MLKPGVCDELTAEIRGIVSSRYLMVPGSDIGFGPDYRPVGAEDGLAFASLPKKARQHLILEHISWKHYEDKGIGEMHARVIIDNVLDGKPQEKWLDGAFDEAVLEQRKIASFKAMVEDSKTSPKNHLFEEMDGDRVSWTELSAAAKLQYIVRDAVIADVTFQAFADVVKDTIGDVGEAALRLVLDYQKERHAIAKLLPDDGRLEPKPLVEQVEDVMDHVSALETQEKERLQAREKLFEGLGNVLDGKPPQGWLEGAKAFQDIVRADRLTPQEVKSQERDGRDI
jgi:hypothetical protein